MDAVCPDTRVECGGVVLPGPEAGEAGLVVEVAAAVLEHPGQAARVAVLRLEDVLILRLILSNLVFLGPGKVVWGTFVLTTPCEEEEYLIIYVNFHDLGLAYRGRTVPTLACQ